MNGPGKKRQQVDLAELVAKLQANQGCKKDGEKGEGAGEEGQDSAGDNDGKKRKKKREDHQLDHNGKEEAEEGGGVVGAPVVSWRKHPYKPLDRLTPFEKQI